jgi:PKD repeat protein
VVTLSRFGVALLFALFVTPSVAAAQGAGDSEYASLGCLSLQADDPNGPCDARRPVPEIATMPASPRAGGPVRLAVSSPGRGVTFAWDLDEDGAFDDGDGAVLTRTFAAGTRRLRVRATDEDGRIGDASLGVHVHAGNLTPSGSVGLALSSPRTGQPLTVSAGAVDRDGRVTRIELDADGDGTYEVDQAIGPDDEPRVEHTVTFNTAGERTLKARFTDDGGVTAAAAASVDVHAGNIAPSVTFVPGTPRVGKPITLTVFGSDVDGTIVKRELDLDDDGTFETPADAGVTHTFTVAGPAIVRARVTDNDGATATRRVTVDVSAGNEPPVVRLSNVTNARTLMALTTDDAGLPAGYAWDLDGDGAFDDLEGPNASMASVPAGAVGTIEVAVRVTDADGATGVGRYVLSLSNDPPGAPIVNQSPQQPRAGQPVSLSLGYDMTDVTKVEWDDGGGVYGQTQTGGLTKTFPAAGAYVLRARVTDSKGRVVTARHQVTVAPATGNLPPSVSIAGYPTVRTGAPVTLLANFFDADSPGTLTYAWDLDEDGQFDDGTDSMAAATFATTGEHLVALRATDAQGGVSTQYKTLEVHADNRAPRVRISAAGEPGSPLILRPGEPADLFFGAESSDDPIVAWAWDTDDDGEFDDGTGAPKTISFPDPGLHRVRLRATDMGGLTGVGLLLVDVQPAQANRAPHVRLVMPGSAVLPSTSVELSASATDPDGDDLSYAWDADGDGAFDDGAARTISFIYAQPGSYDVAVRVTDEHGASRTMLQTLIVDATDGVPPVFSLVFYGPVRVGVPTPFATFVAGEDDFTYTFDLDGDGQFDDTPATSFSNFVWTFPTAQPVLVSVRATDPAGRAATRSVEIAPGAENLAPTVRLKAGAALPGQPIALTAQGSDPDSFELPGYAWDLDADGLFEDGVGFTAAPTFGPGTHTVSVRVTDNEGATMIASQTIVVGSRPPLADFTLSTATPQRGEPVGLNSTSSDPDGGPIASAAWDLDGDGAFDDATGPDATASFDSAGARRVGLKVRDAGGDTGIRYTRLVVGPDMFVPPATPAETAAPEPTSVPHGDVLPPVAKPLALKVSVAKVKLAALLSRGLVIRPGCELKCRARVAIAVDKKTAKRLKLRTTELGHAAGTATTIKVKLSAKARKALRKVRSVRLKVAVVATGAGGRVGSATLRLTVKR